MDWYWIVALAVMFVWSALMTLLCVGAIGQLHEYKEKYTKLDKGVEAVMEFASKDSRMKSLQGKTVFEIIRYLLDALSTAVSRVDALQCERDRAKERTDKLEEEKKEMQERLDTQQREARGHTRQINTLEQDVDRLRRTIAHLEKPADTTATAPRLRGGRNIQT